MLNAKNAATAQLSANLNKEGRQALFSPLEDFGAILTADEWADFGLFPPAEKLAINTNVTSTDIKAQDPYGGPDIILKTDVTDVTASYDNIPVLTPDTTIRALHVGSVPVALAGALAGASISPFAPGMSIQGRLIVIRRHRATAGESDPLYKVYWHPRVGLQNNGEGDNQNQETLQFKAAIQGFLDQAKLPAELQGVKTQVGSMGSIFTIPASKLDALLDVLKDAAKLDAVAPTP
ncbi:hypothetical protein DEIPH_ctg052orf0017 [Deinococcus phoenicis]|uniref:Uncharacterized protein n=1 Tax=Deinococcus phoenicis TaxID=1476583 RepID=A0A016QMC7_9DEIO|nr:hypothetical protein [Deinococcus phoenicis]EYB67022.1 hypothetical protein DEIPH_ctg052orf0017 [Deinococcus phoenicis]